MNFVIRPSKAFLFDRLEAVLSRLSGTVGIDAASANFKNRRMFRTKYYYGLDYDLDLLRQGLAKRNDQYTFGIHADLAKLDALPDNSADAVVSTNTLYQLDWESRKAALRHLCRICAPQGKFLCELSLDKDFDAMMETVRSYFSEIKIVYYRNPVSRLYEAIFEKDGDLGSHPVAGRRPFRLLAWLLSRLEYLTCRSRRFNRHGFLVCSNKIGGEPAREFDLSGLPVSGRIYEMVSK